MAAVGRDQIALCDRNCHKSIEHSLVMTGGIPTYLVPLRNRYGIIGPIPPERTHKQAHQGRDQGQSAGHEGRRHAAGLLGGHQLHLRRALLQRPARARSCSTRRVDRIHFDEAWYAYARFNPIYRDRHAMHGDPKDHKGPTVFATHSTHKLLAALSQASLPAHPRRPEPDPALALQRVVHDARLDLAALSDHRLERHHGGDDGRPGRARAHQRVDRGGGGLPADDGPRPPRVRGEEGLVLQHLERRHGQGGEGRQEGRASPTRRPSSSPPIPMPGCCIRARPGTASATSRTTTACSTRSRCRSSRRAWPTRAASTRGASRPRWSRPICTTAASRSRRPPTSRSSSSSRSASPRASGARCSTRCSTSSATTTATRRWPRCCRSSSPAIPSVYGSMGLRDLADQMFAQLKETRQTHWLAEAFSTLPKPVMTPSDGLPAPGARTRSSTCRSRSWPTACSPPASCRIRRASRC